MLRKQSLIFEFAAVSFCVTEKENHIVFYPISAWQKFIHPTPSAHGFEIHPSNEDHNNKTISAQGESFAPREKIFHTGKENPHMEKIYKEEKKISSQGNKIAA